MVLNVFGEGTNLFDILMSMSGGLVMLSIGVLILIFLTLGMVFIYVWNNGYSMLINKISQTQEKIDKSIGGKEAEKAPKIKIEPSKKPVYTIKPKAKK